MSTKTLNNFFLSIVAPSILAVILFIISFFVLIIPQFEKSIMDRKKEMIRELTHTAWSIFNEQKEEFENGAISIETAKLNAAHQIEQLRYGIERKDYFWIIDFTPQMIMHPYRKELNGTNLSDFKDSHEKKLFVDAAKLALEQGEGFIDYYWQWKDDNTRVVPKLSYVKAYNEWNWIIGTGIYLEDVQEEISQLRKRLLTISSLIVGIIILTLIYVIRQSLSIENKREAAEKKLILSKQKYKTLVDASTEGTLMFVAGKLIFNNLKFAHMLDCETRELTGLNFNEIFTTEWSEVLNLFTDPQKSVSTETKLKCNGNEFKDVVISISRIHKEAHETYIVIAKDVSKQKQLEKSTQKLSEELQTSLLLMNQPIASFTHDILYCSLETTINEAAIQMTQQNTKIIYIKQANSILGTVNDADLKKRVLATAMNTSLPVSEIMSAPVYSISDKALLYEAVLLFKRNKVSHLLVKNSQNKIIGSISNQDTLEMQRNSLSYLIQEIETSHKIDELRLIYNRLPVLINAIIANSDNAQNTTRIITSVNDAITKRVIEIAIQKHGESPCEFAFIAMGSAGRKEQTLKTDQDNAIVFEDSENNEANQKYFLQIAESINKNLHVIGYNFCDGGIMAKNEKWCQPFKSWEKQFSFWIQSPDPQNILDSTIFFDFRNIYGKTELVDKLKQHVNSELNHNDLFFYHLANSIIDFKSTSDAESIDLKKVLLPLVGFVRIYTLQNQLWKTNTIERFEQLPENVIPNTDSKNEVLQVYNYLMHLRLKFQAKSLIENNQPENTIEFSNLSKIEKNTLKKSIAEIKNLQLKLSLDFKGIA